MNFAALHWAHPVFLGLLPISLAPWAFLLWREKHQKGFPHSHLALIRRLAKMSNPNGRLIQPVLQGLAWAGLVVALAGPWSPAPVSPGSFEKTADILMVLDTSLSMRADDVPPNRLERAKGFLSDVLLRHPEVRVGLVVFAGRGFSRVPLTRDLAMVRETLQGVDLSEGPGEGTAMGDALGLARQRLLAEGGAPGKPSAAKVVLLVTDGANHAGQDPGLAARSLGGQGIHLFIAGVGLATPVVRNTRDEASGQMRPLRDAFGQVQYWEPLDEASLQRLAQAHGRAVYQRLEDPRALDACSACLGRWETTAVQAGGLEQRREHYRIPLVIALLCLAVEFVLARTRFRRLLSI